MRVRGWELRLIAELEKAQTESFDWATNNCAHFMATAVRACHGDSHPILKELSRFKTKRGALRILNSEGGMGSILDKHFESVNNLSAKNGDIGLFESAGCIVSGGAAIGKSEGGCFQIPITKLTKVYSV